mmetsp:Transcript_37401/g.54748  ORF Transcript_37401/g.54748 Transcript_37401/m.54748 type:complete len:144 (-) Transcript_37401:153-584(-)
MKCRIEGGGYMCGESLEVPFYHVREAHMCNDPVEPQYYSTNDTRGGRVLRKSVCAICYESEGLVPKKEVLNSRSTGGKDVLPICRYCFEGGITVVTSSAKAVNQKRKREEEKKHKETQRKKAVAAGRRKARKQSVVATAQTRA